MTIEEKAIKELRELLEVWQLQDESERVDAYPKPLSFMVKALFDERDKLAEELLTKKKRAEELLDELLTMATPAQIMEMVECREKEGPRTGPDVGPQKMLKVDGRPFRCPLCEANVFTQVREDTYLCNGCGSEYEGEKA